MTASQHDTAWIRPVRLVAGLVVLSFLVTHFTNHALGLVSLAAMEKGRDWFLALWRNPPAETVLFGALLVHWLLGLWLIYGRRTLRMPVWEAVQIVLGLLVPVLLVHHFVASRIGNMLYGSEDKYVDVVTGLMKDPAGAVLHLTLTTVAWTHGCVGLHYWLRFRRWYPRAYPMLLLVYVLIPVLAVLGVLEAMREVATLPRDTSYASPAQDDYGSGYGYGSGSGYGYDSGSGSGSAYGFDTGGTRAKTLEQIQQTSTVVILALLGLALGGRGVRAWWGRRHPHVRIRYAHGPEVSVPLGWSVLEASRFARIAHASVCGGRARCSTCRIRVTGEPGALPPPSPHEQRVLERVGAPPNVRLACQLRPRGPVSVARLLRPGPEPGREPPPATARPGQEREIAVLFVDLRGFTRIAERRLPYDVVFLLNRYFEAVGTAVANAGGAASQYSGDGAMALFGVAVEPDVACRQAIVAAADMVHRLEALNETLRGELEAPLRLGIGIHVGPAVIGEMGYGETRHLTAFGDTVNTASRLEALTKDYACELVVSQRVMEQAGIAVDASYPQHDLTLRNRESVLRVVVVGNVRQLAEQVRAVQGIKAAIA